MYNMLGMSQTLNLSDGEQVNLYNTVDDFAQIIHDHLGIEAEHAFRELLEEVESEAEDRYWEEGECDVDLVALSFGIGDIRNRINTMLEGKLSRIQLMEISRQLKELEESI